MFKKFKAWLKKHREEIIITATILSITGTVAILLINGKKVKMPVKELAERIVPEMPKATKVSAAIAPTTKETVTSAVKVNELATINVDGVNKTFIRKEFIRHLREGCQPSATKLTQARKMGIELGVGETIVNSCNVNMRIKTSIL